MDAAWHVPRNQTGSHATTQATGSPGRQQAICKSVFCR